jgi:phosphatidate cytidylyltransferase
LFSHIGRLLYNPFSNPHFLGTVWRVGALLTVLLLAALCRWVMYGDPRLTEKIGAVWMLAPVLLIAVFAGGLVLFGITAAIMFQAIREYAALIRLGRAYAVTLHSYSLITLLTIALWHSIPEFALPFGLFLLVAAVPIFSGQVADASRNLGGTLLGYLYIGLPMAVLLHSRGASSWGAQFLVLAGTATALADAAAYFVGGWLRGPRLAPKVSPHKTWTGLAGGMLGAVGGLSLQWWFLAPEGWGTAAFAALAISAGGGAAWGDLIESVIKRDFAVKDTGRLLPGFGGVLDRFDSFLVSIPLSFIAVTIIS